MKLNELQFVEGSREKHYRKGRGLGSGNGKTAGKGHKGQNARSGGGTRLGFEGGQLPLYRALPKRGFKNVNHVEYAVVNVGDLEKFDANTVITPALLKEVGLVKKEYDGVKILGNGKLSKALTVQANKFSKSAEKAITEAGGKVEAL
ncbi:MAG: 50S ribosomal protein L15 [Erysipelotrichaceae bacterium]|jgi:large subunit ribosomal protein L15|nr:50S ribosomal protein L15 [Erysipelotrichaceae bacterium]